MTELICLWYRIILLLSSREPHLIKIWPHSHQTKMSQRWCLTLVHCVHFLWVPLNGPEVAHFLSLETFRLSLCTKFSCFLEPRMIFGSECMSKQQKSLLFCLIQILKFRKAQEVDGRQLYHFFGIIWWWKRRWHCFSHRNKQAYLLWWETNFLENNRIQEPQN